MEKRNWIKMSLPVTPEMHKTISEAARREGQTKASFVRGKLNQYFGEAPRQIRLVEDENRKRL